MDTGKPLHSSRTPYIVWLGSALLLLAGIGWIGVTLLQPEPVALPPAARVPELRSGTIATADSPFFTYSAGWQLSPLGANPPEPPNPAIEPSGVVEFAYHGDELALEIATGDYWAYLYATVDGRPANLLPVLPGNEDSEGRSAGYKTFYEPEQVQDGQNRARWLRVERTAGTSAASDHNVRLEFWRGWGQTPLRAVSIDVLPPKPLPRWPGVLLAVAALWGFAVAMRRQQLCPVRPTTAASSTRTGHSWRSPACMQQAACIMAVLGMAATIGGVALGAWPVCTAGVALLALAGVLRPALWLAALLFGLPFYYGIKLPLLPGHSFSLVDLGVLGGGAILVVHWAALCVVASQGLSADFDGATRPVARCSSRGARLGLLLLFIIVSWALVSTSSARYADLAFREWRTVFLNAALFALILIATLRLSTRPRADGWLLVTAWLAGGAVLSLFGLWGYLTGGELVSQAEGVRRVQSIYDSPNNLALYLDRTVPVALALILFRQGWRERLLWAALAAPQAIALLLTFSKGSLLLAVPAMAAVLAIGGIWLLRRERRSVWPLVGLAVTLVLGAILLLPFLGAERFQRLFDLRTGTGFLRVQLWRSAWQMAQDFPLLGVGPDNFLYHYRSDYILPAAWQEPNLNHPHNLFLDWWTRLGVPGLALGMAWFLVGVIGIFHHLRVGTDTALMLGLLAATAAALMHGIIDVSYALPDLMLVWVFFFAVSACGGSMAVANQP